MISKCEVCQSLVDEEELFCPNCGTEAPKSPEARPTDANRLATYNFTCSGCGASMSYDASAQGLRCPFCGSVDMVAQADARILAPQGVVPFRLSREQAIQTMRKWLTRGFWRPGDLARQAAVVTMTPVFVPFWVFQAQTHTFWTADTSHTPPGARADWYPLTGEHHGHYDGLLVGASGVLTPLETTEIGPFDLSAAVAPDQVDLENITVEQFSLPRKYARPLARGGLEQAETAACQADVPGRARNVHVNVLVEGMASQPVLLPVWIMAYRFRDRVYRFLVNGQTGRSTGQAPTSWAKILVAALALLAAIILLALVAGALR